MGVRDAFDEFEALLPRVRASMLPELEAALDHLRRAVKQNVRIFACGNGGSSAHARHLVAELVGRYEGKRRRVDALCLGADGVVASSLGNDFGYQHALARELEAHARSGDLLIAFSTSGQSPNVLEVVQRACELGILVIALTGQRPNPLADIAELVVAAPTQKVSRIQELHQMAIHVMADAIVGDS